MTCEINQELLHHPNSVNLIKTRQFGVSTSLFYIVLTMKFCKRLSWKMLGDYKPALDGH